MSYSIFGHDNLTGSDIQWTAQYTIDGILSDTAAIYYFLPLLIFTISDPLAAMCGQLWPIGKYTLFNETKTLVGSMAFMISSFGITSLFLTFQLTSSTDVLLIAGLMAVVTTAVEGISQKGYDNLFVPLSAAVILALTST
jgi:dolichol kinase